MPNSFAPRAILVEGVECAGKTTLIRALRERLGWDCKALSHKPADQFERFMREYLLGQEVVFNRGHYSEIVYSSLWSRAGPFSTSARVALNEYVSRYFVVVHCTAELATLRARYQRRSYPQRAHDSELARICELFDDVLGTVPHVPYISDSSEALQDAVALITDLVNHDQPRPQEIIK